MEIFVVPNLEKENIKDATYRVANLLLEDGHKVYLHDQAKDIFNIDKTKYLSQEQAVKVCELVITLGGDGTIIRHSNYALEHGIPVLGINLGRIGFLAQLELENLEELHKLKHGIPNMEERMVLGISYTDDQNRQITYPAINEIVLSLRHIARLMELNIDVDGMDFEHYRADGIIFATPSGSTGYSLSTGGAVIDPNMDAIAVTPICPYSYQKNCIVLGANRVIGVKAPDDIFFAVDGAICFKVKKDGYVNIKQYDKKLKLVNFSKTSYYETLSDKLRKRG